MEVYQNTPSGEIRRTIETRSFVLKGDPAKMAQATIDSIDCSPAPKQLALGSGSYSSICNALVSRLEGLDAQKDITFSTDLTEG
jgi:hypothetical protein